MDQAEEKGLVRRAKDGDDEAFTSLFRHHYSFLYKYLLKLCLRPDLAEDLAQETMLKAYVNLPGFKGEAKFSTWLMSIASRVYLDHQRKEKRERKRAEKAKEDAIRKMKWNAAFNGEEWSDYMDQFASLEPEYRIPVLLRHYYDFTYPEIARMLNLKEGTVKSRVHHGLKKIRKEWS